MLRRWGCLLGLALLSCGKGGPKTVHAPITGLLQLTLEGAPPASAFWAVLLRDGDDRFTVEKVAAGTRTAIRWHEEVDHPRAWKLKFGPNRHPTYQVILLPGSDVRPEIRMNDLEGFHDPGRALAIAYIAIPLDGERDLTLSLRPADPLQVSVVDPRGKPIERMRVTGIRTPRYFFLDGFELESVDALHPSWPFSFWNYDHIPNHKVAPARVVNLETDANGACRFEGFVGWIGILERSERFAWPRSLLAMPDLRKVDFTVARDPAQVRLTVDKLPGRNHSPTEKGLVVEGEWPMPPGFEPRRWSERLPFPQGNVVEFFTPCSELRVKPMSQVFKVSVGETIQGLAPGETRRHRVALEELPHLTIEGEVVFDLTEALVREHCSVELCEAGPSGRIVRAAGALRGPGVPKNGHMPFGFHVTSEGPYTIVVRTGNHPGVVVRDVRAPKEDLVIAMTEETPTVPCSIRVRGQGGSAEDGFVVGTWPHREILNGFISGDAPFGRAGINSFIVYGEKGSAILRNVRLGENAQHELDATLSPGTKVTGRVVDREGKPVAGQWVHLSWPGYFRMSSAYRWLSDYTQPDGRFEIDRVPAGPWRLYARGTGSPVGDALTVPANQGAFDVGTLVLPWR
jgi:hypothetical protein